MPEAPRRPQGLLLVVLLSVLLAGCQQADPIERVRKLHATGLYQDSIEPLRELLETRPDDPEVLYLYGVALMTTSEPVGALWAFEKAMLDPDWLVPAGVQRATTALLLGSHDSAAAAATRVLEAEPDNVQALLLRARARVESRRDYEGGIEDADRVLAQDPDSLEARIPKAVALLALERVEEAEEELAQLEERFRDAGLGPELTSRYCFARVEFAKEGGDLERAEERLETCLADFPSAVFGVSQAIDFYDATGHPERSIEVLRRALEQSPHMIHYRAGLARRLHQAGEAEEAEALLQEATEAETPQQAMLGWVALGEFQMADGRPGEAAEALEQALAIAEDPHLLLEYGEVLVAAERYDDASAVADRIPVAPYAAMLRGRVLQARGRPAEALLAFDEGLALGPNNAVGRYYTARAAEDTGDFARAIEEYRYALRADPAAADARWRLAKLLRAEGKLEPAYSAVTHAWHRARPEPRLEVMAVGIAAELGNRPGWVQARLRVLRGQPALWAAAAAAAVEGHAARRGPDEAFRFVAELELDLGRPAHLAVLAALSDELIEAGRATEALEVSEAAAQANPGFAPFHALRGEALLALERVEDARRAYERAQELAPASARVLAGLARLAKAQGDDEAAVDLYRRAAAADPGDVKSRMAAAELLVAMGRSDEARQLLAEALELEPYDVAVVLPLARLELASDPTSARGRALALRADHFGGGEDARALLAGIAGEGRRADATSGPGPP